MSLRAKLVAALVLLATAATVAIGLFSYTATRRQLDAQMNQLLVATAAQALAQPGFGPGRLPVCVQTGSPLYRDQEDVPDAPLGQCINTEQPVVTDVAAAGTALPVNKHDIRLAGAQDYGELARRNIHVNGTHYRMLTVSLGGGRGAVQIARSLRANDSVLGSLRDRILIAALIVIALAGALGLFLARTITRRITRLTNTAEHVAQTGQLDVAVPVEGRDEAGRLGEAFNEMLSALARSKEDQQRLVQDAGHELRTPLTSLRTNMTVLRRHELSPDAQEQLLDDLDSETRELSDLVNELVELASDRSRDEQPEDIALSDVAERVATRARRRTDRKVTVDADNSVVLVRRQAVERALSNLVDNALKFQEDDAAPIEIVVRAGTTTVLDRGPGLNPDDIPYLFDRFFRSINARGRPGSGLGLSIVRDVAERHGGTVFARPREGGGAEIGFTLPVVPAGTEGDAPAPPG